MVATVTAARRCLLLGLGLLVLPGLSRAHRLDEYLQATLVTISPGQIRLQINFTPGVAVAERVLAQIDRDHDGMISTNEAASYAALVNRQLAVALDRQKLALSLTASNFPEPAELRTGWGIIQLEFSASVGPLPAGAHKFTLKNRHLPGLSVYLFNAAQPNSRRVRITRQRRNKEQSRGEIDFVLTPRNAEFHSAVPPTFSRQRPERLIPNPWRSAHEERRADSLLRQIAVPEAQVLYPAEDHATLSPCSSEEGRVSGRAKSSQSTIWLAPLLSSNHPRM